MGRQHSAVIILLWRFAIQQQTTAPQSGHALLTQVRSMCSWTLTMRLISGTLRCPFYTSPMASSAHQHWTASPTKEGRLPLTSWWRKSWNMIVGLSSLIFLAHHCYDWHPGSRYGWTCNQLTSKVDGGITGLLEVGSGGQFSPSVRPHNRQPGFKFRPPSATVVSAEPFSHGTGTLLCLQKEMATYRHWSVSLWRDPDDVPHCRILFPDKTEWRLISATFCGWRRCFVADQLWFMTRTRRRRMGTSKPQSNGPLCINTVIGTLPVDGWAVTFGTARNGLGGLRPRPVPSSLYKM